MIRTRLILFVTMAALLAPALAPCLMAAPTTHAQMACCTRRSGTPAVQPCCAAGDGQPLAPPQSSARLPQMVLALFVLPFSCALPVTHQPPSSDALRIAPPPLVRSAVLLI